MDTESHDDDYAAFNDDIPPPAREHVSDVMRREQANAMGATSDNGAAVSDLSSFCDKSAQESSSSSASSADSSNSGAIVKRGASKLERIPAKRARAARSSPMAAAAAASASSGAVVVPRHLHLHAAAAEAAQTVAEIVERRSVPYNVVLSQYAMKSVGCPLCAASFGPSLDPKRDELMYKVYKVFEDQMCVLLPDSLADQIQKAHERVIRRPSLEKNINVEPWSREQIMAHLNGHFMHHVWDLVREARGMQLIRAVFQDTLVREGEYGGVEVDLKAFKAWKAAGDHISRLYEKIEKAALLR